MQGGWTLSEPKVTVNIESHAEKKKETSEFIPAVGASIRVDLEGAQTTWSLDYREPDSVVLKVDGKVRLRRANDIELTAKGSLTRDFFDKSTALEGVLEMEFKRSVSVQITGSSGRRGRSVGAELTITF
jgi:hypothetical protein